MSDFQVGFKFLLKVLKIFFGHLDEYQFLKTFLLCQKPMLLDFFWIVKEISQDLGVTLDLDR